MAYERAGDPKRALESYSQAASLDRDNPAPLLHTAVLQSHQHHAPEANQAFDKAQTLLTAEMNQEGLAGLDFERGYAANEGGNPVAAEVLLQKALEEAKAIPSIQLEIRALTELSAAAYSSGNSDHLDLSEKYAHDAIHLAQSNQLDVWAATGFVRLANVELSRGNLQKAEDAAREALQLAQQSQQRRAEAGANFTLASIMDQRKLPDQVIPAAQSALDYYSRNGFFRPATSASLLLIHAHRDKGEYSQALSSAKSLDEITTKSGIRPLMTLSKEAMGSIYLDMEQYPRALEKFQEARAIADGPTAKAYQSMYCADVLWRLGRYSESDEMLLSVPPSDKFKDNGGNSIGFAS